MIWNNAHDGSEPVAKMRSTPTAEIVIDGNAKAQ